MINRARISLVVVTLALAAAIAAVATVGASPSSSDATDVLRGASQEEGGSELPRILTVNGDGAATADPDIADIRLGVETVEEDPTVAIDDNTVAMTSVIDALIDLGIADDDIKTLSFTMWVEQIYDLDGPTDEFRYHVNNQISVRVRDIEMTGDVLGGALAAGANSAGGVSFTVEDTAALEQAARDAAVDNAIAKAEQLADRLGLTLGDARQVSEFSSGLPQPAVTARALKAEVGGGVPITPGDFTVNVSVTIVFDFES